jgi:glycosyltransferase involved in cell wall biosynthesis
LRVLHVLSGKEKGGILRVIHAACDPPPPSVTEVAILLLGETSATLPRGVRVLRLGRSRRSAKVGRALALVRGERFTLVHTHNVISNLYGWVLRLRVPGLAHIIQVHSHLSLILRETQKSRIKRAVLLWGNRRALRRCDRVVAVSYSIRDELVDGGVAAAKIAVIQNAVDLDELEARSRMPCTLAASLVGEGARAAVHTAVVGSVGRLSPVKNHRLLLEAARLVLRERPATFVFVGDGPERAALERAAGDLGIAGSVVFAGWVENPYPILRILDVVALTSNSEGFPVVLAEAMGLERPIVATRVGGVEEIVQDGVCGEIVPPGDARAVADALLRLLGDPARRHAFGRAGREIVARDFSRTAMLRKLHAVYASMVPDSSPAAGSRALRT